MNGKFLMILVLSLLFAFSISSAAQDSPEAVIDSLMAEYESAADDAAKLAVCLKVLEQYPESNYTVPLLGVAKDHSVVLGTLDDFVAIAEKVRGQVTNEKILNSIDRFMLETYAEAGQLDKLHSLAEKLSAEAGNFNLYYDLIKAYTAVETWDRVLAFANQAAPFATAEAYKNDYPNRDLSDEELAERARNRDGILKTYTGWANAHSGKIVQALEQFEAANEVTQRLYLGHTYGVLDYYWGVTLAKAGKLDEAIGRLAPKAIFGEDEESREALRAAYAKKTGSDENFDAFITQRRTELAKQIDDFSLQKYNGDTLTLSSLRGKVILVSFWFPT